MQTPQPLHVDGEQWLPTMSPCHRNSSTAEGSHLCPLSLWGSRPTPLQGTGALRGQAPSRKGTLHSAPQTFPATLAWPSRGLYLDLQEEKPGERRLATSALPGALFPRLGRWLRNPLPVTSPAVPSHPGGGSVATEGQVAAATCVPKPCRNVYPPFQAVFHAGGFVGSLQP